jgi:hypothetical protein
MTAISSFLLRITFLPTLRNEGLRVSLLSFLQCALIQGQVTLVALQKMAVKEANDDVHIHQGGIATVVIKDKEVPIDRFWTK